MRTLTTNDARRDTSNNDDAIQQSGVIDDRFRVDRIDLPNIVVDKLIFVPSLGNHNRDSANARLITIC